MSDVIDKLIYALDGDLSAWNARLKEADAEAAKTGKAVGESFSKPIQAAAQQASRSMDAVKAALAGGTDAASKQASQLERLRAQYDTAYASQKKMAQAQTDLNTLVNAGVVSEAAAAKIMKDLAAATTTGHGAAATATREFRALFDELSSGRTRQTPGTLAIIATRVFGISGATLGLVAAIAAVPVAWAVAAEQVESSLARMRQAMELTGNATGLTMQGANNIASQIASQGGASILRARGIQGALSADFVPARSQALAGSAIIAGSRAGLKEEDVQKYIKEMYADPSKAATELNAQYHLLTVAQTDQVRAFQTSGDKQKAGDIILQAFSGRVKDAADSASGFSKTMSGAGALFGNIVNWFGSISSKAPDDKRTAQQLADAREYQRRFPNANADSTASYIHRLSNQVNAPAQGAADAADQDLSAAKAVLKEYDKQSPLLEKYDEQLAAITQELKHTGGEHDAYRAKLLVEQQALKDAKANFRTPAQIAAEIADDARRVAAVTDESARTKLRDQLAAQREREKNLSNPETAPYAEAIYRSQMSAAGLKDRSGQTKAADQLKNLQAMQEEATAAEKVAKAYEISTTAAEHEKIAGEARTAVIKESIKDEQAYADALQKRAFWQTAAATAQRIEQQSLSNSALVMEGLANGNPAALAAAKRNAEADSLTRQEFADAGNNPAMLKQAWADRQKALAGFEFRDQQTAVNSAQATGYATRQQIAMLQGQAGAIAGGASADQMRHFDVAQKTFEDLARSGNLTNDQLQKQYQTLLPLNEQLSDLQDAVQKASEAAKEYATDVTGPLKQYLTKGGNPLDMLANVGQNIEGTLVQKQLIDPLQHQLEGVFGNLLGGPGSADGSSTAPYYVIPMAGLGGLGGGQGAGVNGITSLFGGDPDAVNITPNQLTGLGGSGSGGLANFLGLGGGTNSILDSGNALGFLGLGANQSGGLFGASGLFGSGGFFSTLFAGLFDDGGTIGPGQWGVKSGIPEIIQGGTSGVSVLPLTAPAVTAAIGSFASRGAGGGGGGSTNNYGGDTHIHNWSFPNVTNPTPFIQSRSQLEAVATQAASRGRRNK